MSEVLEKLQVVIEGSTEKYKKALKEALSETEKTTKAINQATEAVKNPLKGIASDPSLGKLKQVQNVLKQIKANIGDKIKDFQVDSGIKTYTDEYKALQADIDRAEKSLERLNQKQRDLKAEGADRQMSEKYQKLSAAAEKAEKTLAALQTRQKALEASGKSVKPTDSYASLSKQMEAARSRLSGLEDTRSNWKSMGLPDSAVPKSFQAEMKEAEQAIQQLQARMDALRKEGGAFNATKEMQSLSSRIQETRGKLSQYNEEMQRMQASGKDVGSSAWNNLQSEISRTEQRINSATRSMQRLKASGEGLQFTGLRNAASNIIAKFGGMKAAFDRVTPSIKRAGGAFAALIQRFVTGIPGVRRLTSAMNGMGSSGHRLGGILGTLGMTAKFMFASFLIRGALEGAKQGMQNLAQYSGATNASLSMLMSSLTQLKNSLATAFAPILNVIAPILDFLIQKVSAAVSAIGMLIALLTGQGTFIRAKKVQQDYAASLDKQANSADKADRANRKLQRTLLGFDQINKLDDHSDAGSNTDTPSAGDIGGISPGDMFEEVSIPQQIRDFAQKIKEAWAAADFTEIGAIVGNKLNAALASIPWDQIKETTARIAKSIATFLNGFIETTDWRLVGATLAEGFNTAFIFLGTFVENFHWASLGQAIADGINGIASIVDWAYVGQTLSNGAKGLLETLITAVQQIDWWQLGESVRTFLMNIDWAGIVRGVFELLGSLLGGLAAFLFGLIGDAFSGIGPYFEEKIAECGGSVGLGFLRGITDAIGNILIWIWDNIAWPFLSGVMSAFGIHSPSTVMMEIGGNLIAGFFQGILDSIGSVLAWFADLPNKVREVLGNAKEWVFEKGKDVVEGLKNGYESVKESRFLSGLRNAKNEVFNAIGDIVNTCQEKGIDIVTAIKTGYENHKDEIRWAVSGVSDLITSGIGNLWDIGRSAIRSFADGFSSFHIPTPRIDWNWRDVKLGNLSIPIPDFHVGWYAKGGFPGMGEMFIARENGPELVGRMGNRNVVANNSQIVEGIKEGVKEAVVEAAMFFTGSGQNDLQPVIELTIIADTETLYRTVRRGEEKADRRYSATVKI
ncbi:hypothetical protein LI142_16825 [Eubacterium limosum]|uniref:hypothetical protein n=1 Tax=Eubacterium limosum TaxID=1736 RepID=UPI001D08724A|nr:hypothetical protein [Eubacterium limosum]MCB6571163.1 hypothetical protein [Eubacterium limosum]